jgi:uncharacterized damage-inducible protein DinB
MSVVETQIAAMEFARGRTLDLLERIEAEQDPTAILAWRPGQGRAHLGWQLMHIAVTEDIFASERLAPEAPRAWEELWPRFRGGSTPDDDVPTAGQIREVLAGSRERLLATLRNWGDARLDEVPEALKHRGYTYRQVLALLIWHEAHHQGQGHLTFNLWKPSRE